MLHRPPNPEPKTKGQRWGLPPPNPAKNRRGIRRQAKPRVNQGQQ